jgi:hypothetical protein
MTYRAGKMGLFRPLRVGPAPRADGLGSMVISIFAQVELTRPASGDRTSGAMSLSVVRGVNNFRERPTIVHDIDEIFHIHKMEPADSLKLVTIRDAAKAFASVVLANTPPGPDQDEAIRKIREAVWTANAAVAMSSH